MSDLESVPQEIGRAAQAGAKRAIDAGKGASSDLVFRALQGAHAEIDNSLLYRSPVPNARGANSAYNQGYTLPGGRTQPATQRRIERTPAILSDSYALVTPSAGEDEVPPAVQQQLRTDAARETKLRDDFERAVVEGPEALRHRSITTTQVFIPVNVDQLVSESDGVAPKASDKTVIVPRFYLSDGNTIFWPKGERIEDRKQYDLTGSLAVDRIDASVVTVDAPASASAATMSVFWSVLFALALLLLIVLLFLIARSLLKLSNVTGAAESSRESQSQDSSPPTQGQPRDRQN